MTLRTRTRSLFTLVALAAVVLAGCASDEPAAGGAAGSGGAAVDESGAVIDNSIAPLTGVDIQPGSLAQPALSAKIDNAPMARPQVGLDVADIVFEEMVEGGMTRYLAVWHSNVPAEIGPVRSLRPMDPEIVSPFGGIFAYSGGQFRFIQMMLATSVINEEHNCDRNKTPGCLWYRSTGNVAPHNVILLAPEMLERHQDAAAPPLRQFDYAQSADQASAVVEGQPLVSVNTRFSGISSPTWEWDGTQGKFLRFQTNGSADVASGGNQIGADNVIALFVDIVTIEDIPTTRLVSQGKGWVASGGSIFEINWIKATPESPIVLSTLGGAEVVLAKGQTWIELLPSENSSDDISAGSVNIVR